MGILLRREEKWMQALDSFVHARKRAPDYCETDYWIGLTYLNGNMGVPQALEALKEGVKCKYTKVMAGKPLTASSIAFIRLQLTPFPPIRAHFARQRRLF